jgi:hypothetical protein
MAVWRCLARGGVWARVNDYRESFDGMSWHANKS